MKKIIPILLLMTPVFLHAQIQLNNQWGFGGNDEELLYGINKEENILLISSRSGVSGNKTLPSFGLQDAWILKLKQDGSIDKELVLGGNNVDYPVGVVKHGEHYFVALNSESSISGNKTMNNYGKGDFWLVKLDLQFQIVDQWNYGTDSSETCHGITFFNDKILMYGVSGGNAVYDKSENLRGVSDAWVICVDTLGNKLWDKSYGGTNGEYFSKAHVTDDGIIFVGGSDSDIGFDKSENSFGGSSDIWVVKTDFLGNKIWDKTYGDYDRENIYNSKIIDDKLLITGYVFAINTTYGNMNLQAKGYNDAFILSIKLNNPNSFKAKSFGGSNADNFQDISYLSLNKYIIIGSTSSLDGDLAGSSLLGNSDIWISIADSNLNVLENAVLGSTDGDAARFIRFYNNSFMISGLSFGGINGDKVTPNYGLSDIWMLEISHPLSIDNKIPALFFEIYPNPASDVLYFRELNNQFSTLEIVDMNGRVQHSMQIEGNIEAELPISNLNPGTYIAKLQMKNAMWISKKFVKR